MKTSSLEPGLLQVFRGYAWLRLTFALLLPVAANLEPFRENHSDYTLQLVATLFDVLLLLAYLYWPRLQARLGRLYVPLGLALATVMLLIEPNLSSLGGSFLRLNPFLYILLILVAWQYSLSMVVIYILSVTILETLPYLIAPVTVAHPALVILSATAVEGNADLILLERVITFGMLISRLFSLLVLGYVVSRLSTAQREQRQALARANQKLVGHAATLEQLATSRERLRLSRELHDTLAHTLSALAVQFDALATVWDPVPEPARQMLERMQQTNRTGLDETRRALSALRAAPLEELGLELALRALAEDMAARSTWKLALDISPNLEGLDPDVEQCFYRVAQEALENASRHARAKNLDVRLSQDGQRLALSITDDGCGFDPRHVADGRNLGLKVMGERADLIGANLMIHSQPGAGARIELTLEKVA
ncbi:MAG: sensor histidine kinase [Chloroflexota bacterium]